MTRYIGAHLSMAQGWKKAIERMKEMGGNTIQSFSGSPLSWARKPVAQLDLHPMSIFSKEQYFGPIFIHALYLVNLATERPDLLLSSKKSLIYDMTYSAKIGGAGVVVHLGSHLGRGFEAVRAELVKSMTEIIQASPKESVFIIENSAGQNGKIASNFAEIRTLLDDLKELVPEKQIGWCFDTCHAFANGYALHQIDEEIDRYDLWDSLKVIHLNDSRDPFGSGRDRHANMGEGMIGKEHIQKFLQDERYFKYPLILEVPGFDGKGPDKKNMDIVKEMIGKTS